MSIPNSRIPFIYFDIDNSKAISANMDQSYNVLLIGQGKGDPFTVKQVRSEQEAIDSFGKDSTLHLMSNAYLANDTTAKLYGVAVEPPPAISPKGEGVKAVQEVVSKPDLVSLLNQIQDRQFHLIVTAYTENDQLKILTQDMADRFLASRQIEGQLVAAVAGDEKELREPFHSKHLTLLACGVSSPTPAFVWAAALAGVIANSAQIDPARPFNTLPIQKCKADDEGNRFERAKRSRLLDLGYSTINVDFNGSPFVERILTTYKNKDAPADQSYLSLNTLLTLSKLRYSFVNYFAAKYPRHKLADDGVIVKPGSYILTPKVAKCEAIALFRSWEDEGLVENFEQFKSELIVTRDQKDRGRLNFSLSPNLVSQLNVMGATVSFLI